MDRLFVTKTIKKAFTFAGVGIHSGKTINVAVKPAGSGFGIVFIRTDVTGDNLIPACAQNVAEFPLGSCITNGAARIITLEHFMASLSALGITDVVVEMDGEEMPILDGSAVEYIKLLKKAGQIRTGKGTYASASEPVWVENNGCSLICFPADKLIIDCFVDYRDQVIGRQQFSYVHNTKNFFNELLLARTFCFFKDVEIMRQRGLALGGSLDNALVAYDDHYSSPQRYPQEPVRHKVLDLVGDLYLMGKPLLGHIVAIKPSHALNGRLVQAIASICR